MAIIQISESEFLDVLTSRKELGHVVLYLLSDDNPAPYRVIFATNEDAISQARTNPEQYSRNLLRININGRQINSKLLLDQIRLTLDLPGSNNEKALRALLSHVRDIDALCMVVQRGRVIDYKVVEIGSPIP